MKPQPEFESPLDPGFAAEIAEPTSLVRHAMLGQRPMRLAARVLALAEGGVQGEAPVVRRFDGRARVRQPIVNDVGLERISPSGPRDPPGEKDEGARRDVAYAVASIRPGSKGVLT